MGTLIHKVGHGLVADTTIMLGNLVGGEGLEENTLYYVLAAGLTADDFAVSETSGGTAIVYTTDITDGTIVLTDTYQPVADGTMSAPVAPDAPDVPVLTSSAISSVVRLKIVVDAADDATRAVEVSITHKYSGADPQWDGALILTLPNGQTGLTVNALGSTQYGVRTRFADVFGNFSSYSSVAEHTTLAGSDSLTAAQAAALDHAITTTEIADDAISTPKLQANVVTAAKIAAGTITASEMAIGASAFAGGNLLKNGSFELGTQTTDPQGWTTRGGTPAYGASGNAKTGTRILTITGNGVTNIPGVQQNVPIVAGRTYRLRAWGWKSVAGGFAPKVRANTVASDGTTVVAFDQISLIFGTTTTPTQMEGTFTVPTTGTVTYLRVECVINGVGALGEVAAFDDIELIDVTENVYGADGDVVIDSSGITILNGALTLQDEFGKTVATASGFSGDWTDFIRLGLYNARFLSGTVGVIAAGRTSALPYWTLSNVAGSPVATFISGGGCKITFAALNNSKRLVSDSVPVRPGVEFTVPFTLSVTYSAGALITAQVKVLWFKSSGAASTTASTTMNSLSFGTIGSGTLTNESFDVGVATAPSDAFYGKVQIDVTETVGHDAAVSLTLNALGLIEAPVLDLSNVSGSGDVRYFGAAEFIGDVAVDGALQLGEGVAVGSGVISVTSAGVSITASQNNWNPAELSTSSLLSVVPTAARTITGMVPPISGAVIIINNNNATFAVTFSHASASSSVGNRFSLPGGVDYVLANRESVAFFYDGTSTSWKLLWAGRP